MADPKTSIYWDSCTFVSYIEETEGRADKLSAIMEEAINKEVVLYTSAISITEVAFVSAERSGGLDADIEEKIDNLWHPASPVRILDYSQLVAQEARQLLRKHLETRLALKPLDAIHMATAIRAKVDQIQTYDENMQKWSDLFGIKIIEPSPFQMLLATTDAKTEVEERQENRPEGAASED